MRNGLRVVRRADPSPVGILYLARQCGLHAAPFKGWVAQETTAQRRRTGTFPFPQSSHVRGHQAVLSRQKQWSELPTPSDSRLAKSYLIRFAGFAGRPASLRTFPVLESS